MIVAFDRPVEYAVVREVSDGSRRLPAAQARCPDLPQVRVILSEVEDTAHPTYDSR